jgi:hypothetical protein
MWQLDKDFGELEIAWSQKVLHVPTLHVRPVGRPGTEKFQLLQKCTAQREQGFEVKVY